MKKVLLIILCVFLFSQMTVLTFAQGTLSFSDINEGFWAKKSIDVLLDKGVINGYIDGTFKPNKKIKINEFVAMVIKSLGYSFEPINGDWASPYIKKAKELGILNVNQYVRYTSLRFDSDLTREEMIRIVIDVIASTEGLPLPAIENQYIKYSIKDFSLIHYELFDKVIDAYKLGIVSGFPDGTFLPQKAVTRAEAASVLVSIIDPSIRKPYSGNPYLGINAKKTKVPTVIYMDEFGKNVGFTHMWNVDYASFYTLERNYDENGNLIEVYGNGSRRYPTQISYIDMLAPLYKGNPINEVIDIANFLYKNRENEKGYLEFFTNLNWSRVDVNGFKSKAYLESTYIDEKNPDMQSIEYVKKIDFSFGFNPFNTYDYRYLEDGCQPYYLSIYKTLSHTAGYSSYSEYFVTTYGSQLKPIFNILFEKESDKMWNEIVRVLDYQDGVKIINSTSNGMTYRLLYSDNGISFNVSLKK